MRIISSRLVSSAKVASYVRLEKKTDKRIHNEARKNILNEVLGDSVYLLFRFESDDRFEVESAITFQETLTNPFQLLSIFRRGSIIVFRPNKMQHLLHSFLYAFLKVRAKMRASCGLHSPWHSQIDTREQP